MKLYALRAIRNRKKIEPTFVFVNQRRKVAEFHNSIIRFAPFSLSNVSTFSLFPPSSIKKKKKKERNVQYTSYYGITIVTSFFNN